MHNRWSPPRVLVKAVQKFAKENDVISLDDLRKIAGEYKADPQVNVGWGHFNGFWTSCWGIKGYRILMGPAVDNLSAKIADIDYVIFHYSYCPYAHIIEIDDKAHNSRRKS